MITYSVKIRDQCHYYAEIEANDIEDLKKKLPTVIDSFDFDNYEQGGMEVEDIRVGKLEKAFDLPKVYQIGPTVI